MMAVTLRVCSLRPSQVCLMDGFEASAHALLASQTHHKEHRLMHRQVDDGIDTSSLKIESKRQDRNCDEFVSLPLIPVMWL